MNPLTLQQLALQGRQNRRVFLKIGTCVIPALANTLAIVAVPSARLFNQAFFHAQIQHITAVTDPFAKQNIKLATLKWRRHFVFDDFDPRTVAYGLIARFDGSYTTHIQPDRRVKL